MWAMDEIYTGQVGVTTKTLHVPNEGDVVFDGMNTFYRVVAVDSVTAIPTLQAINPSLMFNTEVSDPDNLTHGLRYYEPHITNRIFIDNNTTPKTLSVDARYRIYGSEATQAKLFKGTNTSTNGVVVSQTINSNGIVVSETIDLEAVYDTNNTIKRPRRFNTSNELQDGEKVTLVVYSASGRVVGEHPFIVRNANMISGPTASSIYIEDIELRGGLISTVDPLLIENPLHIPFNTSMLSCRVHYSNGNYADHSIDGNKVKLHGASSFNTGILGPISNVVLSYYPDYGEPAINLQGTVKPSISKTYKLANRVVGNDFALKLYVVPIWVGNKYRLAIRLTDLEYAVDTDVTDYVQLAKVDGTVFRGDSYGVQQSIVMTLNLDSVIPGTYPGYVHVQQFKITLNAPGSVNISEWIIDYGGDGFTYFGSDMYVSASVQNTRKFRINMNQTNQIDWLSWLYWSLDPAYDNELLDKAPIPTHFRLEHGNVNGDRVVGTYSIDAWNDEYELGTTRDWESGKPMNFVWILRDNGVDKVLAMAAVPIKFVYTPDGV
jgi:hypothetical protein